MSEQHDPTPEPPSASANAGTAEAVFLGTGTSVGVPALGCDCLVCQSTDPHNQRTRSAIAVRLPAGVLLIDTPPDLRTQLLRERIGLVHAIAFTHEHADHLFGLDDVRLFPFRLGGPVPLYCHERVEKRIRKSFDYAFQAARRTHPGAAPQLEFRSIDHEPFEVLGVSVTPIPMTHGPHFDVLGFRIGDFAYCTDTNGIPDTSLELLAGVDTFVVGALRHKPHPTHFNIEQAVEVINLIQPRRALLTHISHDLDHATTNAALPGDVNLAYDGLRVPISLTAPD